MQRTYEQELYPDWQRHWRSFQHTATYLGVPQQRSCNTYALKPFVMNVSHDTTSPARVEITGLFNPWNQRAATALQQLAIRSAEGKHLHPARLITDVQEATTGYACYVTPQGHAPACERLIILPRQHEDFDAEALHEQIELAGEGGIDTAMSALRQRFATNYANLHALTYGIRAAQIDIQQD